jgi:hypothetical protein
LVMLPAALLSRCYGAAAAVTTCHAHLQSLLCIGCLQGMPSLVEELYDAYICLLLHLACVGKALEERVGTQDVL